MYKVMIRVNFAALACMCSLLVVLKNVLTVLENISWVI